MDSNRSARVLIVEDEQASRRALALLLEMRDYRVETAKSAEEALELLGHDNRPDVILLDVDLPGMSGLDLLVVLKTKAPLAIPILLTASAAHDVLPATSQGVSYLRKPININHLYDMLGHAVGSC